MDSRDKLINQIKEVEDDSPVSDSSNKSILARGCDPVMGKRAIELIPPMLGNPEMVAVTNDDDFIRELHRKKWSVILFAPGACRYDAAKLPIPGSRKMTNGWGLEQYGAFVITHNGDESNLGEALGERQIVDLLREALESINEI